MATELAWNSLQSEAPAGATDFQKAVWQHAAYYEGLRDSLRLTDFNPLTVDWTKPVEWGNDPDTCNSEDMSEDKGCMMPLGVGFAIVLGFGLFLSVVTTALIFVRARPLPSRPACGS
jgi:hypothetical protein